MSCLHVNYKRGCSSCETKSISRYGCSQEELAYLASQEWAKTVMANMQMNELHTADKTFIGALLEFDKILQNKVDKTPVTEYLANKSLQDIQKLFIGAGNP